MTVVVTGGTGFLGRAMLPRLAEQDDVVALFRPGSDPPSVRGVLWQAQDLASVLSDALPDPVDAVIHLAQSRGYRQFPETAVDVFEVNAAATVRLLDYCRRAGGRTFTYASSGAIYARAPAPISESEAPRPAGFYAASKLAGELAVEEFRSFLAAHSLRFFFIYGPEQRDAFIPGLLGRISEGRDVTLTGPDGFRVNPIFIDDAVDAVLATLDLQEGHTLNLAGPAVVSVREIAELGSRLLEQPCSFSVVAPTENLIADITAQRAILGEPSVGFSEGLRRAVLSATGPRSSVVPR